MAIYALAYDLIAEKDGQDYKPLWAELKRLGAHRVQYSLWLLNLNNTAREVIAHFKQFVDANDALWVSSVRRGEYSFSNARTGTNEWLRENTPD